MRYAWILFVFATSLYAADPAPKTTPPTPAAPTPPATQPTSAAPAPTASTTPAASPAAAAPAPPTETFTFAAKAPSTGVVILVQTTPMSHRSPLSTVAENLAKAHWDTLVLEPKAPELTVTSAQWQSAQEALKKIESSDRKILLIYGSVDAKFQKDSESSVKSMDALVFLSVQTNEENTPTLLKWLEEVKKPLFDITAFFDYKTVLSSANARKKKFAGDTQYRTTQIEGANHDYAAQSVIVAKTIQGWIQTIR